MLPHPTSYMGTRDLNLGPSVSAASAYSASFPPPPPLFSNHSSTCQPSSLDAVYLFARVEPYGQPPPLPVSAGVLSSSQGHCLAPAPRLRPQRHCGKADLLSSVQPKKRRAPGRSGETVPRSLGRAQCFSFSGLFSRKE